MEPDPQEVSPWYLRNITQALALDSATGNVYVRTDAQFNIANANLVVSNVGITSIGNIDISGNTMPVSGNITVSDGGASLTVDGTVSATITDGNVNVIQDATQTTAFEEPFAIAITPVVQLDAVYGYKEQELNSVAVGTGTATANAQTALFTVFSGTTAGSAGSLATGRFLRYRPGQGAMCRLTAAFTTSDAFGNGVANVTQRAGFTQAGAGYSFGYSGNVAAGETGIGILRNSGGNPDIHTLTVTTAAGGTQTGTVTLNSVAYSVPLTTGNAVFTAAQIATGNTWGGLWHADNVGNVVTFTGTTANPRSGTYSFSSTGAGTPAAATLAQVTAGVLPTAGWTYKSAWNGTPVTFDPSYLNVYGIDFRWLGAGIVRFFMENPSTGAMTLVHTQRYASTSAIPHVNNPSFRVGITAGQRSGTTATGNATVTSASMMSAIQGIIQQTIYSQSWSALDASTRAQNTMHHLLSIHNPYSKAGKLNTQEYIMEDLTVALQSTDPAVVYLFINGTASTPLVYQAMPVSYASWSTTEATFSTATDQPVTVFTVGIDGNSQFNLIPYRLVLNPGDTLNICIYSTNSITNSAVGITWAPD